MESPEAFPEDVEVIEPVNERLALARAMLTLPPGQESAWPTLAAAAFCAVCAMVFAFGAIVAPPAIVTHIEQSHP